MKKYLYGILAAVLLLGMAGAYPNGATATLNDNTTMGNTTATNVTAQGGLISNVDLDALSQTQLWQGYVGNITGTIVLADEAAYRMYEWDVTTVSGWVFALNSSAAPATPFWPALIAGTTLECDTVLGVPQSKTDSCNSTFTTTNNTGPIVGIAAGINAPYVSTYTNNASDNATWQEFLLNDTNTLIYAAILSNDTAAYNNTDHDFQMIVPENEYNSTGASLYWFYLDLQ